MRVNAQNGGGGLPRGFARGMSDLTSGESQDRQTVDCTLMIPLRADFQKRSQCAFPGGKDCSISPITLSMRCCCSSGVPFPLISADEVPFQITFLVFAS